MKRLLVLGLAAALAACGRGQESRASGGDTADIHMGMDSLQMPGMQGGGRRSMGNTMGMMAGVQAHMDSVMRLPPDRLKAVIVTHDRIMSQMMDRMSAEMRGMNLAGDGEWNALVDSVRQDLAALPRLEGKALADRMRSHGDRLNRLMSMHEQMMESMTGTR